MKLRIGDVVAANNLAAQVLQQDPHHVGALEVSARALWAQGDTDSLLPLLNRLIALDPYEPGYHALRGAVLQSLGRYGEAMDAFTRSKDLPGCEEAIQELENWQSGLVGELLKVDQVFHAAYLRDPRRACEDRGFRFSSVPSNESWSPAGETSEWVYARPS